MRLDTNEKLGRSGPRFPWGILRTCRWSWCAAELPEAEGVVERLGGEDAAATVAESEVPAGADAVHGGELGPPAPQERAAAVPPDLDAPDLDPTAGRADDAGLPGGDPLGELVGNALRV